MSVLSFEGVFTHLTKTLSFCCQMRFINLNFVIVTMDVITKDGLKLWNYLRNDVTNLTFTDWTEF